MFFDVFDVHMIVFLDNSGTWDFLAPYLVARPNEMWPEIRVVCMDFSGHGMCTI